MRYFPRKISTTDYQSPLGLMSLAASDDGLVGAWFEGQKHAPTMAERAAWTEAVDNENLCALVNWLGAYFSANNGLEKAYNTASTAISKLRFDLRLGTPFQQNVWRALSEISEGETLSYGALAAKLGAPKAARAVGAAVGKNPLSIVIPCHRVVGAAGALTGYAGGVERKRALLKMEFSRTHEVMRPI